MSVLPENVRQVLVKLVPASVISEITCLVFYDNHPRDEKNIDVTVCTKMGEVKEYYQRDLVSSIKLDEASKPSEIRILRNSKCDLFYLVVAKENVIILSRKDNLKVHQVVTSVERYDINDPSCSGEAFLRVFRKADAVPLIFDDNFQNFQCPDVSLMFTEAKPEESLPVITHLMRKLTEAKYSVKCNEKTYKDFLNLHQAVAFNTYKKIHPNLDDSVFKDSSKEMANALKIDTQGPWIRVCNKKIVIILDVCSLNNEILEDVHILLHGTTGHSTQYTTKLFEKTNSSPFWEESHTQTLKPNIKTAIVVVIDLQEFKSNIVSKIEFNGVIFYRKRGKECLLPIEDVKLSSLDIMGEEFDAFSGDLSDSNIMLAILATTEKTDLILRHIKRPDDEDLNLDIFCKYLLMERVPYYENVAIHRRSPYHILNGIMVVLNFDRNEDYMVSISVYSRSPSQVLAVIVYIHDAMPLTLVITTPNQKVTAKLDELSKYNEDILGDTQLLHDYQNYASSILNRANIVLKYLDNSMMKMSESKNPVVQSKIGSEIDLFAAGEASYLEFKDKMREEAAKGVKTLNDYVQTVSKSDKIMCVDLEYEEGNMNL